MLLAYVDESYTKEHYWIAALLCPEDVLNPLTTALDAVVAKASTSYRVNSNAELHGYTLFHGKEDWEPLAAFHRARIGIYHDALEAIAGFDVEILIRGMDLVGQRKRYAHIDPPHGWVLGHLLERIDERAEAKDELVMVIADQVDQADVYRQSLWHFQRYKTSGYRARQLKYIVDTIHFVPSTASRLVQAADLIAYLHMRIRSGVERDDRALRANVALWDRVQPRVVHRMCWYP